MAMSNTALNIVVTEVISLVVRDFQSNPKRFWNERDVHWSLFYYMKQSGIVNEDYPTQLIRAEFPTLKIFRSEKQARGHYDLVIINYESWNKPEVQNMKAQTLWEEYLKLIKIDVAIEVKLWLNRLQDKAMQERANWDIRKLTEEAYNVQDKYFLNFVQLDFQRDHNTSFYQRLHDYLSEQRRKHRDLNILCVPSDLTLRSNPKDNWL